jgi:hypothetical protein
LYALLPLVVALFGAENGLRISRIGHQGIQAGIVILVFGLVEWWLSANRYELMEQERRQTRDLARGRHFTARRLITDHAEDKARGAPMFHLPPGGLRHTLEDAFDLDIPESDPAHRRPE